MDEALDRVTAMEKRLNDCREATDALRTALDRFDALRGEMKTLFAYYGSETWFDDREAPLPDGTRCGVLGEDDVYDALTDVRDEAIRMLELSADVLKNVL